MKCKSCKEKDAVKYSKYSSGEFCSRECARGYSTKAKRKQINEKVSKSLKKKRVSKSLKKKRVCKYCGVDTLERRIVCSDCKPYIRLITFYERMGITGNSLKHRHEMAVNRLRKEYFIDGDSLPVLKERYKMHLGSLGLFFANYIGDIRSVSEALSLGIQNGTVELPLPNNYQCGEHTTWDNTTVWLRSSYEFIIAQLLDKLEIHYEVESIRLLCEDGKVYIPDFYLPDYNLVIETKSQYFHDIDDRMVVKEQSVKTAGYDFLLLLDSDVNEHALVTALASNQSKP